jgi:hypothetical protein
MPRRRRATTTRTPAETSDLSGLALVASAIGNIAQASKSKDLEREREQLVAVLRDWQEAYHRLEERARALRTAYEKVATQLEKSERERQQWHMKFLACEGEQKARSPALTPREEGKR